jgi:16S rRNA (adenine1518-N6/adenine1519-N6)-dimethyltransferase
LRLGQHFLVDEDVARRQVDHAGIDEGHTVLEIGPGKGVLTKLLVERAGHVIAVELDPRFASSIGAEYPKVEMIVGDARKVELPDFDRVVANIPYYISSEITFRLLETDFELGVVMYQREFAERLTAEYGRAISRLTVNAAVRAECTQLEVVPRSAFRPVPKVDSALVEIVPRTREDRPDGAFLDRFLTAVFSARRKRMATTVSKTFGIERDEVESLLPIPGCRVDELSVDEIIGIVNSLQKMV